MYPQSKIPLLTQITHIDWFPFEEEAAHLSPDTLIFRVFHLPVDKIVFRVVDYRTNCSTCFSVTCFSATCFNEKHDVKAFFVLFKALKSASNYLLGRQSRRRHLLSSSVHKEYQSGPFHPCRPSRLTFATTVSITIPPIYRHSSKFPIRIILYPTIDFLNGQQSLPGISDPFISTYIGIQNFRDSKSSSNLTSVIPLSTS